MNARLEGDAIVQEPAAHIGIAVDTERGLLVVVLRDVQDKSLRQIAAESQAVIQLARAGSATPDDLRGSTFTLTNLGMYEIDSFTPIINLEGLQRILTMAKDQGWIDRVPSLTELVYEQAPRQ